MLRSIITHSCVGLTIAIGTLAAVWWLENSGFLTSLRWQVAAIMMLGAELIFLLFVPANKGGQQFGPHGSPTSGPLVSSGADFYDRFPSRRLGDIRWLIVGIPILLTGIVLLISL